MSAKKITDKQEEYVQGLLKGLSQRKAYKAAYNTSKMKDKIIDEKASRLLAEPKVRARFDELKTILRREAEERGIVSAIDVIKDIVEVKNRCMSKIEPITERLDGEAVETGEYKFEHAGALKALELLGKYISMFDNTKVSGEKIKAETEFIKIKTNILKGDVKDVDKLERIMKALNE